MHFAFCEGSRGEHCRASVFQLAEFPSWREVRYLGCGEMLILGAFSLRKVCGSSVEPKSRQGETLSGVTGRA